MKNIKRLFVFVLAALVLAMTPLSAAAASGGMGQMEAALQSALAEIGLPAGDRRLLLLTNAGYGQIDNQTTETFLDIASAATGGTIANRSLLPVHSSMDDGLWFSLYRKDTAALLFVGWSAGGIRKQKINAAPEALLTPTGWKEASSGAIGNKLFSVVSISHVWAVNPPWTLFWAGAFHNHICPGVNIGYIAGMFVKEKLPLHGGDRYVFDVAPAICMADALQVMFDATAGKGGAYTDAISKTQQAKYALNGVAPMLVALRVNKKKDLCDGMALGFDYDRAFAATGIKAEDFHAESGPAPMIARVKLAVALAGAPIETNLQYIVPLKRFSGKAALANTVVKGDPYAAVWDR